MLKMICEKTKSCREISNKDVWKWESTVCVSFSHEGKSLPSTVHGYVGGAICSLCFLHLEMSSSLILKWPTIWLSVSQWMVQQRCSQWTWPRERQWTVISFSYTSLSCCLPQPCSKWNAQKKAEVLDSAELVLNLTSFPLPSCLFFLLLPWLSPLTLLRLSFLIYKTILIISVSKTEKTI